MDYERFMVPESTCETSPQFPLQAFLKICLNCEWDETWTGVLWQFALPALGAPLECCAIQERAGGRWFIGSPVPR